MISDISAELQLTEARAAELGIEERTPQALLLHLVLQMVLHHRPLVRGQLGEHRLERDQLIDR